MGSSRLFLLGKDMDGGVKCPRSSMCTIFLHARGIQQKVAIFFLTATNCFQPSSAQNTLGALFLYSAAVSQWAQCFLDLFPHFSGVPLLLLLTKMPGYYHCPLSYYFLLHTVPVCAFFQVYTWILPEVHTWVLLHLT